MRKKKRATNPLRAQGTFYFSINVTSFCLLYFAQSQKAMKYFTHSVLSPPANASSPISQKIFKLFKYFMLQNPAVQCNMCRHPWEKDFNITFRITNYSWSANNKQVESAICGKSTYHSLTFSDVVGVDTSSDLQCIIY